jgi:hypothetical protein
VTRRRCVAPFPADGSTLADLTEDDAVRIVRSYIEGLFPKVCPKCGTQFASLRDYLRSTTHLGSPYFLESAREAVENPLGPIAHALCICGHTLTIGSEGIPKDQLVELITWARADAQRRSVDLNQVVRALRDRIDVEVLHDDEELPTDRRALKDSDRTND